MIVALVESRFDETDHSFLLAQHTFLAGGPDPILRFGPLTAPLSSLFADSWHLTVWGFRTKSRTFPLRLRRGHETWKVGRATIDTAVQSDNLACFVIVGRTRTDQVMSRLPLSVFLEADPFTALARIYPPVRRAVPMIGNQTLSEFALERLRETP